MWVRGLKLKLLLKNINVCLSHPMWVRGLKLLIVRLILMVTSSHPMWVRGLKQMNMVILNIIVRRTLCGCVD